MRGMKTKHASRKAKPSHKTERGASKVQPTLVCLLLDRTGSMQLCKDETIKGFNGYIAELKKQRASDMRFSLTQFDSISVDLIHDAVPMSQAMPLTTETYEPRGATPLYDAIGGTIRATEKKAGASKVLFVTLTDGQENASSEWNENSVRDLIKSKEDKDHWTFVHIGVGANGWRAVANYAMGTSGVANVMNIQHDQTRAAYRSMACATANYCSSAGAGGQSVTGFWKGHTSNLTSKPADDEDKT